MRLYATLPSCFLQYLDTPLLSTLRVILHTTHYITGRMNSRRDVTPLKGRVYAYTHVRTSLTNTTLMYVKMSLSTAGMWKGLVARILMIGTLTGLQWFIYDSVKVYFRLPRPPPPEMPESLKRKLAEKETSSS